MSPIAERARRDPGGVLLLLALLAAIALYTPTLGTGLVNLDDPWLVQDNAILAGPDALGTLLFDLTPETRFVLGAEYLPVRDLSVLVDHAVWGETWGGYHLTNLLVYLAAIALWFAALVELGLERRLVGLALLLWAVHPTHAEAVAWVSERKGLLGAAFAALALLGYARFRRGAGASSLVIAALAAIAAVWSKAPSLFVLAALAPLELLAPRPRSSTRRALVGLAVVGGAAALAFVPVLLVAMRMAVVEQGGAAPAGWLAMALGIHGFYVQLAAMLTQNAISYPIATAGPTVVDIVVGALALIGVLVAAVWRRAPVPLRIAAWVWLLAWFPVSRLVLPLRAVLVADRYLLLPTLGACLALAYALWAVPSRGRSVLIAVVVIAASLRAFDARTSWRDPVALWERATAANPGDGDAWSAYAEALAGSGDDAAAGAAIGEGLTHTRSPRLLLRAALFALDHGDAARGRMLMLAAADAGEVRAQANAAVILMGEGAREAALRYAQLAVTHAPYYAKGHQVHARVQAWLGHREAAIAAYRRAIALAPAEATYRCQLGELIDDAELRAACKAAP